jgi:hypothetical protein
MKPENSKPTLVALTENLEDSEFLWDFSHEMGCHLVLCQSPLSAFHYLSDNPSPKVILFDWEAQADYHSDFIDFLGNPHFQATNIVILSDYPFSKRNVAPPLPQACYLSKPLGRHVTGGLKMLLEA